MVVQQIFIAGIFIVCMSFDLLSTLAQIPPPVFKCTKERTCEALVGYVPSNTTTLASIKSLFEVSSFNSLLGANLLPASTLENDTIFANQTVRVPFPCRCINGSGISDRVPKYTAVKDDGLYEIAQVRFSGSKGRFSGLVTYQQIQVVNNIADANLIYVGQRLWIPLPCSCDEVEGQKVVHYGHVVASGSSLDQIAAEFETTSQILMTVNGITPDRLMVGQVLDIPLKGQVLDHLATPSKADGDIMKGLASHLTPLSGWSGSDFCIWSGVVCDSNGSVTSISLPSKNLSGSLPSNLNSLSQLTSISLQNNHLSGALPSFANLKFLQEIHLESNNFTSVPNGAFSGLNYLRKLSLDDNPTFGPWPLPVELAGSTILAAFSASNANLIGPIPDIFSSLTSLQILRLSSNNLTGVLPPSFCKTKIEYLWLDHQHIGLSGNLDVLVGMNSLKQVQLADNNFTGPLPDLPISSSVFDLQLGNNLLTGVVPQSFMSLPGLLNISLQENKLQGPYPIFPERVTVNLWNNLFCKEVEGNCDPQVMILLEVAATFGYPSKLAEAWQGNDACMLWAFVTCDESKRIVALNLSKQGFRGTISPALANLTSLRDLYLNDNGLTGTIPESFTTLPQLRVINVSSNDLNGQVPNFRSSVTVSTTGNKRIESRKQHLIVGDHDNHSTNRKSLKKTVMIVAVVLIPTISIAVLWIIFSAYKKRKHLRESQENAEQRGNFSQLASNSPTRFTFEALKVATNSFDMHKKLGRGGFGSVFEGNLSDGTRVAVKRLDHHGQGQKEFLAEVCTIGSIHHVNLVKLVGFCAEKMNRVLVYEYMSNGSLDKWIFNTNLRDSLTWDTKKKIILHIAKGLAYLHEECQKRIAHLDVKPQNVLLDDEFNAKLSDFGLAKLIDRDQSFVMTQMRGTRGYLAPEWLSGKITEKADIYSYGIVVLEVVFGRKNFDCSHPDESTPLIYLAKKKGEENKLSDLLDKCCQGMHQSGKDMEKTVQLAIWCLHTEPVRRPSMSMVVKVLEGAMMPDTVGDYSLTILETELNPAVEATQISVSVLSGPR